MTFDEAVEKYAEALLIGDLMTGEPETSNIESVVQAWVILKHISDCVEERLKALREVMLVRVEKFGRETERGGSHLFVDGTKVMRECRRSSLPEEKALRAILTEHGIALDQAFSKVTKVVLDASKVEALVSLGKIPEEKVEAAKKVSWALKVRLAPELEESLDRIVGAPAKEVEEKAPRAKRAKSIGSRKGA